MLLAKTKFDLCVVRYRAAAGCAPLLALLASVQHKLPPPLGTDPLQRLSFAPTARLYVPSQGALLQALHVSIRDKQLPLASGSLWNSHLLPARRKGTHLELKGSSFKKLSKLLQVLVLLLLADIVRSLLLFTPSVMSTHTLLVGFGLATRRNRDTQDLTVRLNPHMAQSIARRQLGDPEHAAPAAEQFEGSKPKTLKPTLPGCAMCVML